MIKKSSLIAMGVESETTAIFNELLEDEEFKKLAIKELKSKKDVFKSVKILSKYANNNLI
jgi:hypothetical protein|tara:strand:+ start:241 stop:420 length:180 start_codon:yes stop_codon:yes gene_type:complete